MERIKVDSYIMKDHIGSLVGFEKTLTQQSFANEVDVNVIVERAVRTGILGDPMRIQQREAVFADVSSIGDYNRCLNAIIAAQNAFLELPAGLRARFGNDPAKFLDFINDPAHVDECVELGIFVKKEVPAVVPPVVPAESGPEATHAIT